MFLSSDDIDRIFHFNFIFSYYDQSFLSIAGYLTSTGEWDGFF
jgi:hypothetical protein